MKKIILNNTVLLAYKKLWPFVKPYWFRAVAALVISIPIGAMDAAIAYSLKPYMDEVLVQKSLQASFLVPLFIIVFSLFQSFLNYSGSYLNSWVGGRITADLKGFLFKKLMRLDPRFFDQSTSGDILFRFNQDANAACAGLLTNLKNIVVKSCSTISLMFVLIYNCWQLALIAILAFACAMYPLSNIRKKISKAMNRSIVSGSAIMTHYNEAYSGNRVIASYNMHENNFQKFFNALNNLFKLELKMLKKTAFISPFMHFTISLGIAGVIWYGSYLILSNQITPGTFVSFLASLLMLYQPLKSMGTTATALTSSIMAVERVFSIIESEPTIKNKDNPIILKKIKNGIEYKDVVFSYNKEKKILDGMNLTIKKGQTIAFVGSSGGGKTTLVSLLPRFYDVTAGSIKINDIDIRDYEIDSLRDKIAVVFQDNFLFSGTLRENITLGLEVSDDVINEALKNSCLDVFVNELPEKLDTQIGERGVLLSGGQKQRVAIARAFLKNAPIVILDEATSALDSKSEIVVQKAIYNLMRDRTVLIIAHRLSTVRNADRIIVIGDGMIKEEGTHDELLANKDSLYNTFYNSSMY